MKKFIHINLMKKIIYCFFFLCTSGLFCADLVVFSFDRPLQLYAFLESVEYYVKGLEKVTIIYRATNEKFEQAYQEVKTRFSTTAFYRQGNNPHKDFKQLVEQAAFSLSVPYVLFAVDDIVVKDFFTIECCVEALEKLNGYAFYLWLGKNITAYNTTGKPYKKIPPLEEVDGFLKWDFKIGEHAWGYPHTVDMAIFRKKDIEKLLRNMHYGNPNELESGWASSLLLERNSYGICFEYSKIVNIPLNRVQNVFHNPHMNYMTPQELLALFNAGYKMDISLLHKISNSSVHMDYIPQFIKR